jgi:siroheme synthase (precorrin-2 oxidase/ferrochelatase)
MLAEFTHPLPHGAIGESTLLGDFLLRTAVDKNGTQRLVTTMARMGGLAKKVLATVVIHDPSSLEMSIIIRDKPRNRVESNCANGDANHRETLRICGIRPWTKQI